MLLDAFRELKHRGLVAGPGNKEVTRHVAYLLKNPDLGLIRSECQRLGDAPLRGNDVVANSGCTAGTGASEGFFVSAIGVDWFPAAAWVSGSRWCFRVMAKRNPASTSEPRTKVASRIFHSATPPATRSGICPAVAFLVRFGQFR